MVEVAHPAVGGDHLSLTYKGSNPGPYDGLDRFGRVVDQKWQDTAGTPVVKDRYTYGYDYASNRLWRENALTHGTANKFDEFYTYDGLDRLTDSKRGTLSGGPPYTGIDGTAAKEEVWALDALGNWPGYVQKTAGTADLEQTRVHNKVNETHTSENHGTSPAAGAITEGQGQPAWQSPGYDAAGNMTAGPRPGSETTQNKYVYDAWNRLVKVTDASDVTIAEYRYDGLHRRIAKMVRKVVGGNERWDRTDYYYNESWQVVEERFGLEQTDKDAVAMAPRYQYVWDIRYIDAPVCRDENKNSDGDCTDAATGVQGSNTGDEHLYYCQDANFNVTALVDGYDGAVVERYLYDPYGKVSVRHGVRDASGASTTEWNERSTNNFANDILYCGYRFDPESGLYHVRYRYYHPTLGRWVTRDPIGYADAMDLYEYVRSAPSRWSDPLGLASDLFIGTEEDRERARKGAAQPPEDLPDPAKKEGWSPIRDKDGKVVGAIRDDVASTYQSSTDGQPLAGVKKKGRNCAGHATGLDKNLQPKRGVPLRRTFEALGWDCYKMGGKNPRECKCPPDNDRLIVTLHRAPGDTKTDLWNDPWPGGDYENKGNDYDFHCFKGPAGGTEEGDWTDVPGQWPNEVQPRKNPFSAANKLAYAFGEPYCCCKCRPKEQSKPPTEVSYAQ